MYNHVSSRSPLRYRNVFVLCTGRCGSTTFSKACGIIANYTSGHETRSSLVSSQRLAYPDYHIEVDNRLSWFLGRLDEKYGKDAYYVHLKRDVDAVAKSFVKRWNSGIMRAYRGNGIIIGMDDQENRLQVALDYVETVTANIKCFLKDKPNQIDIDIAHPRLNFEHFWESVGAEGDIGAAFQLLEIVHNSSR